MSYAPDEPESVLNSERGVLAGIGLGLAAWGVLLTLAIQCVSSLTPSLSSKPLHRYLFAYVFLMFSLGTIAIFTHLKWVQEFMIDNRNFPGGPLAYDAKFYANSLNITGVVCYFIMNWMADGLLLYRLFIIWNRRALVVAFPILMYLTSVSLSVVDLITLSHPGNSMFTDSAVNFGLLYWSFSISLNVVVTGLIVSRLLYMRRRLGHDGGRSGKTYIGVSAMLIESAALYSLSAIVFLVGYSLRDPLQFAAEPVEVIQGIAPLMIILRVANGQAVTDDSTQRSSRSTSTRFTSMAFTPVAARSIAQTMTYASTRTSNEDDGQKFIGLTTIVPDASGSHETIPTGRVQEDGIA
ncbi:hypothetical protein OF83DRAFT_1083743 [Amylostereum chailletii]|nr:hypothetical protein OF83DRAFT_1083743 [Amylostereum chailletii]